MDGSDSSTEGDNLRTTRRDALRTLGGVAAVGVAWTAPQLVTSPAAAQGSVPPLVGPSMGAGDLGGGQGVVLSTAGDAWITPDGGQTWARMANEPSAFGATPSAVAGAGFYVAIDGLGGMWAYDQGATAWAAVTSPAGPPTLVGSGGPDGHVTDAAGNSFRSTGFPFFTTWVPDLVTLASLGVAPTLLLDAASGNLALDASGNAFVSTVAGVWAAATSSPSDVGVVPTIGSSWRFPGTAGAGAVGIDSSGNAAYSSDGGVTWSLSTTSPSAFGGVPTMVAGGRMTSFAAMDAAGNSWFSLDNGANWSPSTTSPASLGAASPQAILGGDVGVGRFAAVGLNSGWYSTDGGDTWAAATTPPT